MDGQPISCSTGKKKDLADGLTRNEHVKAAFSIL